MEYDIEILMPVCRKYLHRVSDFKRYGLLNISDRRVLLSLVTSNEQIRDLEIGWPEGVDVRVINNSCPNHIANLYAFYANLSPERIKAKWLMRLDDDSCTDIGGLMRNLDDFYDWEDKFYLGDLNEFIWALRVGEDVPYEGYRKRLGAHERIVGHLKNEVECGIISKGGLLHMLRSESCMGLLKTRAELEGGHGDCAVAVAAALAKFYPIQCPFISKDPMVDEFSIFGDDKIKNHIHLISRVECGDNFEERNKNNFLIIAKSVDKDPTEKERSVGGKKFLAETNEFIKLYQFHENYSLKIKFEDHIFHWMEDEGGLICVIDRGEIMNRFKLQDNGGLADGDFVLNPI